MGKNTKSEKSLLCEKGERPVQCLQWEGALHVPPVRGRLIVHCALQSLGLPCFLPLGIFICST